MLHDLIDETLQNLSLAELGRLLWSVDVWELAGQMTASEATAWRARIRTWQRRKSAASRRTRAAISLTALDWPRDLKILD